MNRHDSIHRESLPSIGSIMNPPMQDMKRETEPTSFQYPQPPTPATGTHFNQSVQGQYRGGFGQEQSHGAHAMSYPSPAESRRTSDERTSQFPRPVGQTLPPVRDLIHEENSSGVKTPPPIMYRTAPPIPPYSEPPNFAQDNRVPNPQSFGPAPPPNQYSAQPVVDTPQRPTTVPVSAMTHDMAPAAPALHVNTKVDHNPHAYPPSGFIGTTGYAPAPASAQIPMNGYPQPASYPYSAGPASATAAQFTSASYARSPPFSAPAQFAPGFDDRVMTTRVEERIAMGRPAGSGIGESVKRRLDEFGLEHGIIQVQNLSRELLDFTQQYTSNKHGAPGYSAPIQENLPDLDEIDKMLNRSQEIQLSLNRMRDFVLQEDSVRHGSGMDGRYNAYGGQTPNQGANGYSLEQKDSNFGPEPKKRRGRAAAAGRCHSCNRSETPEWRRGPDGARTLCNACGLHYAKLTRKMGATNAKAVVTNSSLRPRSMGPGDPA